MTTTKDRIGALLGLALEELELSSSDHVAGKDIADFTALATALPELVEAAETMMGSPIEQRYECESRLIRALAAVKEAIDGS